MVRYEIGWRLQYKAWIKPLKQNNLVSRAHVSFGQRQDTELWNKQFPESKILRLPVSRRIRALA